MSRSRISRQNAIYFSPAYTRQVALDKPHVTTRREESSSGKNSNFLRYEDARNFDLSTIGNSDGEVEELMKTDVSIDQIIENWVKYSSGQNTTDLGSRRTHVIESESQNSVDLKGQNVSTTNTHAFVDYSGQGMTDYRGNIATVYNGQNLTHSHSHAKTGNGSDNLIGGSGNNLTCLNDLTTTGTKFTWETSGDGLVVSEGLQGSGGHNVTNYNDWKVQNYSIKTVLDTSGEAVTDTRCQNLLYGQSETLTDGLGQCLTEAHNHSARDDFSNKVMNYTSTDSAETLTHFYNRKKLIESAKVTESQSVTLRNTNRYMVTDQGCRKNPTDSISTDSGKAQTDFHGRNTTNSQSLKATNGEQLSIRNGRDLADSSGEKDLSNCSAKSKSLTDSYGRNTVSPGTSLQGQASHIEWTLSDKESSAMSVYDKVQYSERLKEFEKIIETSSTDQGEYVYLSQVNGLLENTMEKVHNGELKHRYNVQEKLVNKSLGIDQTDKQVLDQSVNSKLANLDADWNYKKDKNDNVVGMSDQMNPNGEEEQETEGDLKKIIQECLWYFHSQVESHRGKSKTNKDTQSDQQGTYVHLNRKYRLQSHPKSPRPRSMTDMYDKPSSAGRQQRSRSLTETEITEGYHVRNHGTGKPEVDDRKSGDGLSVVADLSSATSRNVTQLPQSRIHTLPPRVPNHRVPTPDRYLDRRETSSIRRRPNISKRSKSTFNMSVSAGEPYNFTPTQHDNVSTGRMFIEDVLSDINQTKVSSDDSHSQVDTNVADDHDKIMARAVTDETERDIDNNEIKPVIIHNNGRVHVINNHSVPLSRSMSAFQFNMNAGHKTDIGSKHFKSLSSDGRTPLKILPNFTKDSKFIRTLSQNSVVNVTRRSPDSKESDLKSVAFVAKGTVGQSSMREVSKDVSEDNKTALKSDVSDQNKTVSTTSNLGVFDIVGEDSGCLYPWQRDVSTQYEALPGNDVYGIDSKSLTKDNMCNNPKAVSDIKTTKGINKSNETVVRRQRLNTAKRPHSIGYIDTMAFDADLAGINELQHNSRARLSEPFLHNNHSFHRKQRHSHGQSDEPGSPSNLESIMENPAEITLKNSAHRNVLPSPSVSPEMWKGGPDMEAGNTDTDDSDDDAVFNSPLGKRRKPARHRSSGSITSGSEDSENEPSQPLARRGRRSAIVDTKNCGDVSPTTLSPEASPSNSSDEGENASGHGSRRRSSGNNVALNVYPGDLLVQEHHKKLIKRNTIADFYAGRNGSTPNLTDDNKKQRQPFSLLKLMKTRSKESLAQLSDVLQTLKPTEFKDNNLAAYKNVHWTDLIASTDRQGSTGDLLHISAMERKRRESVWELFKSECVFLIDHLMVLKNCFLEPLKKLQVEGFLMYTEPSEIFSNLEDLCYVSYTFCKDFIGSLVKDMSATDFGRTSVLIKALQRFSAHSKDGSVYHTYCLNYSNALTYLEKLRKNDEFCEFEKWCEQDPRCNRLQLADLLIGPMQHCTKLPLLLRNIRKYTEDPLEKRQVAESIDKVESSLEQLEDKMKWLKNFERVQEIQRQLVWPTVSDLDPRAFIPETLKSKLSRQPCARLLACPTRQLLHEGPITLTETTKSLDAYMFLFDDILLVTKMKKRKQKQTSAENTSAPQSDTYTVHRQPLALDRLGIHDLSPQDAAASGMKFAFVIVQISRFQQIIDVFTLQAPTDSIKTSWLTKIKNAKAQYHSLSRANSIKEDVDSNSLHGRTYHGKSKSIDTVFL